jgi:hypothetical protein
MYEVRQWFLGTDDRKSFCLLTLGAALEPAQFAFDVKALDELMHPEKIYGLTPHEIDAINPNTNTAPVFRCRADAELTAKIYKRVPVLVDERKGEDGNPWGVSFMTMFHMANDSSLFRTAVQLQEAGFVREGSDWIASEGAAPRQRALALEGGRDDRSLPLQGSSPSRLAERYVPLYEAKMIHQFDHRWSTFHNGDSRDVTLSEKTDKNFEPTPRYWVPERQVHERLATKDWMRPWLMGWRDIVLTAVERTVIFGIIPRSGVGNTCPLIFANARDGAWVALLANLDSLVLDYVARVKIGGTHLTYNYLRQFPILTPFSYSDSDVAFITSRALELTYTSLSMQPFARDLGYDGPPYAWDEARRAQVRAELDAWYARAYGLTRDELRYILDPADVKGPDYPSETFRVLKSSELKRFGEYRTGRLVLQAWDAMESGSRPLAVGNL